MGDFVKLIKERVRYDESYLPIRQLTIEVVGLGNIDGLCSEKQAEDMKITILGKELLDILKKMPIDQKC